MYRTTYYMIVDENQNKAMSIDGYMSALCFPYTTLRKENAQKVIDKWKQRMIKSGLNPYRLLIKEVK
jgi:hypothetical protein